MHDGAYDDYRVGIKEAINSDPRAFFGYVDLKKKCVGYPTVTSAIFLLILYNEYMLMIYGCLLLSDQISSRMTHLLVLFSSLRMRYRVFC
jgi:hypothetical protein